MRTASFGDRGDCSTGNGQARDARVPIECTVVVGDRRGETVVGLNGRSERRGTRREQGRRGDLFCSRNEAVLRRGDDRGRLGVGGKPGHREEVIAARFRNRSNSPDWGPVLDRCVPIEVRVVVRDQGCEAVGSAGRSVEFRLIRNLEGTVGEIRRPVGVALAHCGHRGDSLRRRIETRNRQGVHRTGVRDRRLRWAREVDCGIPLVGAVVVRDHRGEAIRSLNWLFERRRQSGHERGIGDWRRSRGVVGPRRGDCRGGLGVRGKPCDRDEVVRTILGDGCGCTLGHGITRDRCVPHVIVAVVLDLRGEAVWSGHRISKVGCQSSQQ